MVLSELNPGEFGEVVDFNCPNEAKRRLLELGIIKGSVLEMISKAPLGEPYRLKNEYVDVYISKDLCDGIVIKKLNKYSLLEAPANNFYKIVEFKGGLNFKRKCDVIGITIDNIIFKSRNEDGVLIELNGVIERLGKGFAEKIIVRELTENEKNSINR